MKRLLILGGLLALAGCGAREGLKPAPGQALPPAPFGATATPRGLLPTVTRSISAPWATLITTISPGGPVTAT